MPGATSVPIRPIFSWNPADWATGYEFTLARDSEFTDVVVTMSGASALPNTVWAYDADLDYATTYFWRVRAVSATSHSEWAVSVFTTEPAPSPAPLPLPSSPLPPSPPPAPQPGTLLYIWVVVGTLGTLLTVVLILIVRTLR